MLIANNRYQMGLGIIIIVAAMLLAVTVIIIIVTATAAVAVAEQPQPQQQTKQPFKMSGGCITDVSGIFLKGYYDAHAAYFPGQGLQEYNETLSAPPSGQKFYYDPSTGQKLPTQTDNARAEYIQGYKLGWKDAQKGVYQVDC